jgi:hypothetical protein
MFQKWLLILSLCDQVRRSPYSVELVGKASLIPGQNKNLFLSIESRGAQLCSDQIEVVYNNTLLKNERPLQMIANTRSFEFVNSEKFMLIM